MGTIRAAVARAREQILQEYLAQTGEDSRLLRLALNEAEALAWNTGFPHLFFPQLAQEKAETTIAWQRRQRSLRGVENQQAFAE